MCKGETEQSRGSGEEKMIRVDEEDVEYEEEEKEGKEMAGCMA